jgi:hypothetical protein
MLAEEKSQEPICLKRRVARQQQNDNEAYRIPALRDIWARS